MLTNTPDTAERISIKVRTQNGDEVTLKVRLGFCVCVRIEIKIASLEFENFWRNQKNQQNQKPPLFYDRKVCWFPNLNRSYYTEMHS